MPDHDELHAIATPRDFSMGAIQLFQGRHAIIKRNGTCAARTRARSRAGERQRRRAEAGWRKYITGTASVIFREAAEGRVPR